MTYDMAKDCICIDRYDFKLVLTKDAIKELLFEGFIGEKYSAFYISPKGEFLKRW